MEKRAKWVWYASKWVSDYSFRLIECELQERGKKGVANASLRSQTENTCLRELRRIKPWKKEVDGSQVLDNGLRGVN